MTPTELGPAFVPAVVVILAGRFSKEPRRIFYGMGN
jgi:hypothetical protein